MNPTENTKRGNAARTLDFVAEPAGASFKFGAKRNVGQQELLRHLEKVPDVEATVVKDSVAVIKVDKRDIDGIPYMFTIIYLHPDGIEVMYTITPEISMRKRRLELLRYIANLNTLLGSAYSIDVESFMQLLDVFLEEIKEFATSDYEKLYTKYDALLAKNEELKERCERLSASNERLSKDVMRIRDERNALKLKVDELEKFTDDALMLKVQEWIREHGNEINIGDFCGVYKVGESRVEQILNKMVREGYLEIRR